MKAIFFNDLSQMNWKVNNDINDSFNSFITSFSQVVDKHAPLVKLSKQQFKLSQKPWIDPTSPFSPPL